jgi:hypothetical protein
LALAPGSKAGGGWGKGFRLGAELSPFLIFRVQGLENLKDLQNRGTDFLFEALLREIPKRLDVLYLLGFF